MHHRKLLPRLMGVTLAMIAWGTGCISPGDSPIAEAPPIPPSPTAMPLTVPPTVPPTLPPPTATPGSGPLDRSGRPSVEVIGQLGGAVHAALIQGEAGYLSVGQSLLALTLTDPAHPQPIGSVLLPDIGWTLAGLNDMVYVGGSQRLYLVDVSHPAAPTLAGSLAIPGRAASVALQAPIYAYVAYTTYEAGQYQSGVVIVDVSHPATPVQVGSFATPGPPEDIVVVAGPAHVYAYVTEPGGLRTWDVSDAAAPRELSFYPTDVAARQVVIRQSRAYVAQASCNPDGTCRGGLLVLDVADPARPKRIGSSDTPLSHSLVLAGDYAYGDNLNILDISDPANLTAVSTPSKLYEDGVWGSMVAVRDQYAYLVSWLGLTVVNVAQPSAPAEVAFYDPPGPQDPRDIAVADGQAYVADGSSGLALVDVSNPATPTEVGSFPSSLGFRVWTAPDWRVYLGNETGLEIIDAANPTAPAKVGEYRSSDGGFIAGVTGHHVYVSNPVEARVVDLGDPARPIETRLKTWPDSAGCCGWAAVANGYAYVVFRDEGWQVMDDSSSQARPVERGFISGSLLGYLADGYDYAASGHEMRVVDLIDWAHPVPRGLYQAPGTIWEISAAANGTAYVIAEGQLRLVDVSDPDRPREAGVYGEPFTVEKAVLKDRYLYLLCDVQGVVSLQIVDVSNPSRLIEVGRYTSPESFLQSTAEIELVGNYAYLFDKAAPGLLVIDVSNPSAPSRVALHEKLYQVWAVEASPAGRTYAYLYDDNRNVRIADLTNPRQAVEAGFFDAPGWPAAMSVLGSRIYIGSGQELVEVDASNPARPVEMGRYHTGPVDGPLRQFGGYIAIPTSRWGLHVIDLAADPPQSRGLAAFTGQQPDDIQSVVASPSRVVVKFSKSGTADRPPSTALQIFDVGNPAAPRGIGYYQLEDFSAIIGIWDDYLYLSDPESRLRILDLSDPAHLTEASALGIAAGTRVVVTRDGTIYQVGSEMGLLILQLKR